MGTEWEFRIGPPGEEVRTLVPDVAYLSYERLGYDEDDAAQAPCVAPYVAREVISPNDRRRYVDEKIGVYLASGAELVVLDRPATAYRRVTRRSRRYKPRRSGRIHSSGATRLCYSR